MTPLQIEILLWHYTRAAQYPDWNRGTAQAEVREWMLDKYLLQSSDSDWHELVITERGKALVHALCDTPLPVLVSEWKIPER